MDPCNLIVRMTQTRFSIVTVDPKKIQELDSKLKELYHNIKSKFKKFGTFQEVIAQSASYSSKDLVDNQEPEEFAKQQLIEPLINFLGYELVSETVLASPAGKKTPDYTIRSKDQKVIFYVEAEPINTDLRSSGRGVSQVDSWLISKAAKSDYGIATDGLLWIVRKFDAASARCMDFHVINLKPIFLKLLNPASFIEVSEIGKIEESFLYLDCAYIFNFLERFLERIEEEKEAISKRFYNDYVRYVFGFDEKGNTIQGTCLIKEVTVPLNQPKNQANLFSIIFMNRLIFIKFLEEKRIISKDFLKKLYEKYQSSGTPSTFYETYLKPLFYEVFNKEPSNRISVVRNNPFYKDIPYLNGGLFRKVIPCEDSYNISNEGIELVLENLLEKYSFGLESGINPDILGYIFEKTINFISGTGTNQQKMQGAYYTPDDVVGFIVEKTLTPVIFNKMLESLRKAGWSESDLKGYDSLETLLDSKNMPKNPVHIREMLNALDDIRVLDPACGSGHFLTAMLHQLLRIKESLLSALGENIDRYNIKREIISKNLFGVDIDENAVEIARLRLWLSLIEEVNGQKHIKTLPNIDFNIVSGNALIGWLNENLTKHPLIDLSEDEQVKALIAELSSTYPIQTTEICKLLQKLSIENTISAYDKLVEIYSLESGERAVKIKEALEKVRKKLYVVITGSYIDFLNEKGNFSRSDVEVLGKNLESRNPFHWKVDFGKVIFSGGFDVVVGNPPYIEDRNYNDLDLQIIRAKEKTKQGKRRKATKPLLYESQDCGNTHAYFIERSISLLKFGGLFGFIVPISLVSTDRMSSIRKFIHNNSSEVSYYNFDDRPGKIFSGLEHCRATIVVTKRGSGVKGVTTSKYHRWYTQDRPHLLENLQIVYWQLDEQASMIPKIGTEIEKHILDKLSTKAHGKRVGMYLVEDGIKVWYYNAPQYWIHAHTEQYLPKVEYYHSGELDNNKSPYKIEVSSHYKSLEFDADTAIVVNGLLNSSLFYWWFVVWSDGRDLLSQHITSFPINPAIFRKEQIASLEKLVDELMQSYEKNSNTKINERSGGYIIKIKEVIPKKSKEIIDKIDDIFGEYFGFSKEELEFIKNFDAEFRMDENKAGT
ncbi:MAG: DNA methyltransferase [Candidatus Bathyarchaeia archaeon]